MNNTLARKLIQESRDITTIIDSEGTITYVSPSVEYTLGYDPNDLVGEDGFEYQHPANRDAVSDAIESVATDPDDTQIVETRFRHADGSWRWLESSLQNRLTDPDINGILVNSREISKRKQQEMRTQRFAKEYKTLLENVDDSIFFIEIESTDAEYIFRFKNVNDTYEKQTGLTTDELKGKTPIDVFGENTGAEVHANYRRCVQAREPISYEEEIAVETGARFWQTALTPVIIDGEVTKIIGIARNITERVSRERQLRKQKEQLDEFASVVSHDLRNPLNVAQSRAELLETEIECKSEHLGPVVESLERMEAIISDTLTLARQGQAVSDMESLALVNLVGESWRNVRTDEATIEFEDDVTIRGDRSRLQHVFENLFRNAIEHGGADVTVRIGRIDNKGIYVEDTGPGIPEDARETVFEAGHTSASGGTGFGLTIVKRIAEAHGWQVEIVSGTDGGARFELTGVDLDQ